MCVIRDVFVVVVGDKLRVGASSEKCDAVVTIGQIASYVPGSGAGAAAAGKSVSRRRGVRRDHDRVSKAEDVPEYKGSLPVEELLAFVEGSVASPGAAVRMPSTDTKLRRTRRKEPLQVDGDSKLVDVTVPLPHLASVPTSEPLAGLLNGSSKPSRSELTVNYDGYVDQSSENEWLSSELASRQQLVNENFDDGVVERKEKEFVVVQKKRKPKVVAAVNGDAKSIQPLNGFCFSRSGVGNTTHDDKEDCTYVNGFGVEEIPETNGSSFSRNSSKDSLAQSSGSDIDDLSHFVGEDGHSGGEQYVDAPLSWSNDDADDDDDDKEESLSSFCSTMSSAESRHWLNSPYSCKVESPDVDQTDVVPKDRLELSADHLPDDSVPSSVECGHLSDSTVIHATQRLTTEPSSLPVPTLCTDSVHRCTCLCCMLPYKHVKHQVPVLFYDLQPDRTIEDVSSIMFSFGCTMSDHLVDGGLCVEAKCAAVLRDMESELAGIKLPFSEFTDVDGSRDDVVSFMYRDSIPEHRSSDTNCTELLQNCTRTCNNDVHSTADCVKQFRVRDVQSYMYTSECFHSVDIC